MLFFAGKRENLPASIWFIVINRSDKGATKEDKSGVTEVMIILRLDRVMADRKMSLNELAEKVAFMLHHIILIHLVFHCHMIS